MLGSNGVVIAQRILEQLPESPVPEELRWEGTFEDYLGKCLEYPRTIRTAHQRLWDTMSSHGQEKSQFLRRELVRYKVFEDPFTPDHKHAVFGLNVALQLMKFMRVLKAAAQNLGQERRMYLLRGPVGTAKSTISELIASALEAYSVKPEGQLFAPVWVANEGDDEVAEIFGTITRKFEKNRIECPLHEEPLKVLPIEVRAQILTAMKGHIDSRVGSKDSQFSPSFLTDGDTCPLCNSIFQKLLRKYKYNWRPVVENHLRVRRYVLSRADRHGIVITRPKSEKDQDVTEFLGSTNFSNLGAFGSIVDPRTFDWAGHYMAANRGTLLFEEQLKFALAFLYDCLGATQEKRVQPRGFMEVSIDVAIIGTTNMPEYKKLQEDNKMEALRDRMIIVDIPYILNLGDEVKIYRKFFDQSRTGGKHIAPRTLYLASYYGILSRLTKPKASELTLRNKLKLYDGRQVSGFTEDAVPELMNEAVGEGIDGGISPRYIHDKISAGCMAEDDKNCVNFFAVIDELKGGLANYPHATATQKEEYAKLIDMDKEEMEDRISEDIQDAAAGSEEDMLELFEKYISQIVAYINKEKVRNPITHELEPADEQFLQSIEDKLGITDYGDFRQKILNQMQKRALEISRNPNGNVKAFDYRTDEKLYRALRQFLFDQMKDKINWERLVSRKTVGSKDDGKANESERVVDKIKANLMSMKFGDEQSSYCEICASEVLVYFASATVRAKKKEGKRS